MIKKRKYLNDLFDLYGSMLTEKQKSNFVLYYQEDLSLGEIAELEKVSRNAIYDNLKRTEKILLNMEEKIGFSEKKIVIKEDLRKILKDIGKMQEKNKEGKTYDQGEKIRKKINDILENL